MIPFVSRRVPHRCHRGKSEFDGPVESNTAGAVGQPSAEKGMVPAEDEPPGTPPAGTGRSEGGRKIVSSSSPLSRPSPQIVDRPAAYEPAKRLGEQLG